LTNASARAAEFVATLSKTGPTVGSGLGHLVATWIAQLGVTLREELLLVA